LPFKLPGRDTPVKELALGLFGLAALDGDDILFGGDRNLVRRETGNRQRYLVPVVGQTFDVVRGIRFLGGALGRFGRSNRRSKPMVDRNRGEKSRCA
jgi:hypothetical protein